MSVDRRAVDELVAKFLAVPFPAPRPVLQERLYREQVRPRPVAWKSEPRR